MIATMKFKGTGNELFGRMFVGVLLSAITLGIYLPWFLVGLAKYVFDSTSVHDTEKGDLKVEFKGTGGEFFVNVLVGYLLSMVTLGIYLPWFIVSFNKLCIERTSATASDGTVYTGKLNTTGGETFGKMFIGVLLTAVTFGIYGAWFNCAITKHFLSNTAIFENGQAVGKLDFTGQGGALFKEMVVGVLLTVVTFGIYAIWFNITMTKFFTANTKLIVGEKTYSGKFNGTGNTYFGIIVLGTILSSVTFGIYYAWELANILKFRIENSEIVEETTAGTPTPVAA